MKKGRKKYSPIQLASAAIMMVALLWLTISAPFVYASQQELAKQAKVSNLSGSAEEEDTSNGFGNNTTEEKKPNSGNTFSEEYLHNHHNDDFFVSTISQFHKSENAGLYTAFHGEVQVPPPNVA